jgi:chorismate mutase
MSPRNTQLDELRRQIDGLDDRIHDLLIERSAMIEQIIAAKGDGQPKLRPGREAEIARRIVGRHQGHFPAPSLVRIWREVINAFTCMQGPFSIGLSGAADDRRIRELARDHFGGTPERVVVEDIAAALRAAIDGEVTLAVLPWGKRAGLWLGDMLDATGSGLQICFGLPFVRANAGVGTAAVAVGRVESEPTESDRSLLAIGDPRIGDRETITAAARQAELDPMACFRVDGTPGAFWVLKTAGRLGADAPDRLGAALGGGSRIVPLGAYAAPIILSSEA